MPPSNSTQAVLPKVHATIPRRGTPRSRALFQKLFALQGWRLVGELPDVPKAVAITAPHTSNIDGWYICLALLGMGLDVKIMAKESLFKPPLNRFMRWLGMMPIKRNAKQGLTASIVHEIQQHDKLWIAIAPEGTRSHVKTWKSGFYHIAVAAQLPIVMVAMDYDHKVMRLLGTFRPTGNYERDLPQILAHYRNQFSAKNPNNLSAPLQALQHGSAED